MRRGLVGLALLILVVSCDPFPATAALGITTDRSGSPVVIYLPCPNETIRSVSLVVPSGNPGGGDDEVLWEITNTSARAGREMTVSPGTSAPSGFTTTVPLNAPLPQGSVSVLVNTSAAAEVASTFALEQLRKDRVLTADNTYESMHEFEAGARGVCGRSSP